MKCHPLQARPALWSAVRLAGGSVLSARKDFIAPCAGRLGTSARCMPRESNAGGVGGSEEKGQERQYLGHYGSRGRPIGSRGTIMKPTGRSLEAVGRFVTLLRCERGRRASRRPCAPPQRVGRPLSGRRNEGIPIEDKCSKCPGPARSSCPGKPLCSSTSRNRSSRPRADAQDRYGRTTGGIFLSSSRSTSL